MTMAEMQGFGKMDINDRGGKHTYEYDDVATTPATPGLTPSQTVGPFFAYGLTPGPYGYAHEEIHETDLTTPELDGERIVVEGQVLDSNGVAVHDAVVEFIQADASGAYASEPRNDGFTGFGRCGTGPDGKDGKKTYQFHTVKPGATQDGAAPFITVIVTMRGLLNHCITRIYFPGDDVSQDPVMKQVPAERRQTLMAQETGPGRYRFDIHMQGDNETVFFDL